MTNVPFSLFLVILAILINLSICTGKELVVTVQKAMNEEQIMSFKEAVAGK